MKLEHPVGTKRYIFFRKETLELTYCADGLWRAEDGCIFAYPFEPYDRTDVKFGVGLLSVPCDDPLSLAAAGHDYQYECPAYQLFHTREEADQDLRKRLSKLSGWRSFLAWPAYVLSRLFGGILWENKETR